MSDLDKIRELQNEINELRGEMQASQQKLFQLQQKLNRLQGVTEPQGFFKNTNPNLESFSLENFIGLRLIHVVGIIVLVIGLSIGVKYAIDRELISEAARIGLAYSAGLVLYILSWKLKEKYTGFSAILFSGAMASLYFTTYGAYVYYKMFPFAVAFVLMIAFTLFTVYNALKYNRQEIAVLGLVGAYAIPFLISQNADRADLFFTYISLINIAVVFLSYKRRWKLVVYIAQAVTWILFIGWGTTRFEPQFNWIALLFMSLFFALYIFNALAGKLFKNEALHLREIQEVILNNVAIYVASLVLFAPSFSSAEIGFLSGFFSIFIGAQAILCYYFFSSETYMKKMLGLLSIVLFLVFIANKWDGISVTLIWLLSAIILFSWGFWSKAVWLRMSAIVLMGVTLLKLATVDSMTFTTIQKIIAYLLLGVLLMVIGFFYQKFKQKIFEK